MALDVTFCGWNHSKIIRYLSFTKGTLKNLKKNNSSLLNQMTFILNC